MAMNLTGNWNGNYTLGYGTGLVAQALIALAVVVPGSSTVTGPATGGGLALVGGDVAMSTIVANVVGAAAAALGALGAGIVFAGPGEKLVEKLKRGMDNRQKNEFQRLIEKTKKGVGRGGADNLSENDIYEIFKEVMESFKKIWRR